MIWFAGGWENAGGVEGMDGELPWNGIQAPFDSISFVVHPVAE